MGPNKPAASPHIAVNARLLLAGKLEGIGRFAHETLKRITDAHPEVRFSFIFDRPYDASFVYGSNVHPYVVPPPARHPLLWYAWFHQTVPLLLHYLRPDAVFSPEFYLPAYHRAPAVNTIHDLAYEHYPEYIPRLMARYCRYFSPRYARRAAHILTVSEFSKADIVQTYGISDTLISVVYNGASACFHPQDEVAQRAIRSRYTDGAPYFLYVGSIHPRKNIEALLRAFDAFKLQVDSPVRLVIAGRKAWQYDGAMQAYEQMQHKDQVIFTGYLSDLELAAVYGAALALCYVPRFEGFGIPPLEAMHCDVPVICSDTSSLPEVAGDAALLVNPDDVGALAQALVRVAGDSALRARMIAAGRLQRTRFSWDKTAAGVWDVLSKSIAVG